MNYKVNWTTRLNYDAVLENVDAVVFLPNNSRNYSFIDIRDREAKTDTGYPWYKGAFGNCLIYLNGMRTDKLYLLNSKSIKELMSTILYGGDTKQYLESNALHIIDRKETINAKAG